MRVLAFALLLSGALAAQTRKAAVGRVLDLEGKPAAKATVTLFWTEPGDALGERTDKIEVVTDEHGRFVAQMLPQRGYSAFATSPSGMVSAPQDGLAAGADLELRLVKPAISAEVELRGGEAWKAEQPLRLLAFPVAMNRLPVPLEVREGRARLPPVDVVHFAILDAKGQPLHVTWGSEEKGRRVIALPPPFELRFRVVDEKGAPVDGAEVLHPLRSVAAGSSLGPVVNPDLPVVRHVGCTDSNGHLTARVPATADPWLVDPKSVTIIDNGLTFLARKTGRGTSVAGLLSNLYFCNGETSALPADRVLAFALRPAMRMRLSPPMAHVGATLATRLDVPTGRGHIGTRWLMRCDTDAAGWFELPFPGVTAPGMLEVDPLRLPDGRTLQRSITEIPPGPVEDRIELAKLRRLSVQVLGSDAGPARGVSVLLMPHSFMKPAATPAYTDQGGRVQFQVGGGDWLLFVCDRDRAVWRSLRDPDTDQDWQLTLQPLPAMVCRIVDGDGKPLPRAVLRKVNCTPAGPGPADDEGMRLHSLAQTLAHGLCRSSQSDADGLIRVPMLGNTFTRGLVFERGNLRSLETDWKAGAEPVTVPIR